MYPQMVYHADVRAREMELAADRQMGCSCSPLGRMVSRMITKCNGREGRVRYDEKMDYAMAYAPTQTCYVRPTARTVTLATSNSHHPPHAHAIQPEAPHQAHATATATLPGTPFPSTGAPPQGARKPKKKKKKPVRFTPSGPVPADDDQPPPHHAQHHTATVASSGAAGGTAGVVYHHGAAESPSYPYPAPPPAHGGQGGHGYAYGYGRYAPSPLPRWDTLASTPRRHEYFSGEYRWYYPTPVREGIYSIATDANGRLSTIFSEENPNACTIV
ncbi:trithorax group protein osa-like [Panicum miliaceum]|uniref:Trithorax group protein osa-like n=1 Tax=Panicum miliaceum TaxID=4540 RepID=A0A3L6RZ52_PANMI|nr:trithorax group protein osa-like [Panicum miliaceum]